MKLRQASFVCCLVAFTVSTASAQQPFIAGPGNQNGGQRGLNGLAGPNNGPPGQQGGGANADFDSLIDLIVSTVASETWAENGGGEAEIRPYVGGVYADSRGALRRLTVVEKGSLTGDLKRTAARLASVRERAAAAAQAPAGDARTSSGLRCVSLARLERELVRKKSMGEPVEPAMLTLAGLRRVRYVVMLPPDGDQPGDVVLAGPAGDWRVVGDGRIVAIDNQANGDRYAGGSIVRLDDLLTLMRRVWSGSEGPFGCSINPRSEALAEAQAYLNTSAQKPIAKGRRDAWLKGLRERVGEQDIEVFGVDPSSRVAGVLVEADHHMKLVGIGLAESVPGVKSYLDQLAASGGEVTSSTGVLRWWFAMNYSAVNASPESDAFELVGAGAKVMSETELLTERGGRVPTGQSDELAAQFAADFTRHFERLCNKYPVYAELRNTFDLALAVQLAHVAHEADARQWRPGFFLDARQLPLPAYERAKTVQTVVNHREVNRRRFVASVSGGVWSDARSVLKKKLTPVARSGYGPLGERPVATPGDLPEQAWWWDAQ
ncbi:MAG: DUF1598 domain-containing protein [Planctomycetota bacterium]